MKSLVVVFSYHHKQTEKIENVLAKVLDAPMKPQQQIRPEEPQEYNLAYFGSGMYGATFHASLLVIADKLRRSRAKKN